MKDRLSFGLKLTRGQRIRAILCIVSAPAIWAQSVTVTPQFEAVSVKPCKSQGGGRGGGESAGRLRESCVTLLSLVRQAYVEYANGRQNLPASVPIEGGPAWITSDPYEIDATAQGAPSQAVIKGPMLQALLEDRFKLKIRRVSREVPVYALTVAKGGSKLAPTNPGSCVPFDTGLPAPYPQFCGTPKRRDPGLHLIGATMADLCKILSAPEISDRPVVDRTGITGMFDIHLPGPRELNPGATGRRDRAGSRDPAESAIPDDPSASFEAIKDALQRLGLNFERSKGSGEFLMIDHVEIPSEN
jgi:uncharacterized protein (TIGR03435 family)